MLKSIGVSSIDELFQSIPQSVRLKEPLKLPAPLSEIEVGNYLRALAERNTGLHKMPGFLGGGCYNHYIPAVVDHLAGRSEFYTSYTPYQPEISQGNLQAFFEFQTMMCELTGLEVSNVSLYDGATATAEAVLMALAVTGKNKVVVSRTIHPEYRAVLSTYLADLSKPITLTEVAFKDGITDTALLEQAVDSDTACVVFQTPNFFGILEPCDDISRIAHKTGALLISVVNPISLALLKPPAEYGADIAVGEAQALGNRMSFGGPHLGFMVTKKEFVRKMPGRIVGQTVDTDGKRGFVLTLSTREQHIRREKATSNICSNQALMATRATIYLAALGKQGLAQVASLCLQKAHYFAGEIAKIKGYKLLFNQPFFNEFTIQCPESPAEVNKTKLLANKIIGGLEVNPFYPELKKLPDGKVGGAMLLTVTEMNTKQEMDKFIDRIKQWFFRYRV